MAPVFLVVSAVDSSPAATQRSTPILQQELCVQPQFCNKKSPFNPNFATKYTCFMSDFQTKSLSLH